MTEPQQTEATEGGTEESAAAEAPNYQAQNKELQAQLAKAEATITRLDKIDEKYGKLKADEAAAKQKKAEEEGAWQELHTQSKADLAAQSKELEAANARLAKRDAFLQSQVDTGLAGIESKEARKDLEGALSSLSSPMDKLTTIQAFVKATGAVAPAANPAKRGGKPGAQKPKEMTRAELAKARPEVADAHIMQVLSDKGLIDKN